MSNIKKEDRRVRYTKRAIKESFLKLLSEKPIEKISVTEICRDADINRGTFYSHYDDPFDLKEKLVQELVDAIKARMEELNVEQLSFANSFRILKEHQDLCQIFYGENGDIDSLGKIIRIQTGTYMDSEYASVIKSMSEEETCAIKLMLVSCITSVTKVWIDYGMKQSPELVANTLSKFITNGISAFLK